MQEGLSPWCCGGCWNREAISIKLWAREAVDLEAAGDPIGAYKILVEMLAVDLRCLDAHAQLGNFSFERRPEEMIRHYEVGLRIGELSLAEGFDGVLPWGFIDNRPFLRCMHGSRLCLWRLGRGEEAASLFERMLWLNPADNQGIRVRNNTVVCLVREEGNWLLGWTVAGFQGGLGRSVGDAEGGVR